MQLLVHGSPLQQLSSLRGGGKRHTCMCTVTEDIVKVVPDKLAGMAKWNTGNILLISDASLDLTKKKIIIKRGYM